MSGHRAIFREWRDRLSQRATSPAGSRAVFTNPAAPPWFNVVLAEPSIKVLGDPPDQAQFIGGVNATWASERSMVEVSPPLASAPWN